MLLTSLPTRNGQVKQVPYGGSSASSLDFPVFVPEHRQPIIAQVLDHRQTEAGVVADVVDVSAVDFSAESGVDVRLADTRQTGVLVQHYRQRVVEAQQI